MQKSTYAIPLFVFFAACAAPSFEDGQEATELPAGTDELVGQQLLIQYPDNLRTVSAAVGDTLVIRLPEPASGAQQWRASLPNDLFETNLAEGAMPGCARLFPGCAYTRQWILRVPPQAAGQRFGLAFALAPSGLATPPSQLQEFHVTVKVAGAPLRRCSSSLPACGAGKSCEHLSPSPSAPGYCVQQSCGGRANTTCSPGYVCSAPATRGSAPTTTGVCMLP